MKEIRLLIADGQALIREGIQIFLNLEKHLKIVGLAQDGLEAFLLCDELKPDVVLMDINMPTMNGIQITKKIKEKYPRIKVIILSSNYDLDITLTALESGADECFLKSLPYKNLARRIRKVHSNHFSVIEESLLTRYKGQIEDNAG